MSVVRLMIDSILEDISKYILDEISSDLRAKTYLVSRIKSIFDIRTKLYPIEEKREMAFNISNEIKKFEKIRKNYHQGKSFIKNKTKGKSKGYRDIIFSLLESYIRNNDLDNAKQKAKEHLEWVQKRRSERTYYRHKKRIKELGIIL